MDPSPTGRPQPHPVFTVARLRITPLPCMKAWVLGEEAIFRFSELARDQEIQLQGDSIPRTPQFPPRS